GKPGSAGRRLSRCCCQRAASAALGWGAPAVASARVDAPVMAAAATTVQTHRWGEVMMSPLRGGRRAGVDEPPGWPAGDLHAIGRPSRVDGWPADSSRQRPLDLVDTDRRL